MLTLQAKNNPRNRALFRAREVHEDTLLLLDFTFDFLHLLLDIAIFAFLFGLIWLLPTDKLNSPIINLSPRTSNFSIIFITGPLLLGYLVLSLISGCHQNAIYSTPLSRVIRHIIHVIQDFKRLFRAFISALSCFRGRDNDLSWDQKILEWLFRLLRHDLDLEQLLQSIPGFYHSDVVKEPAKIFRPLCKDEVPRAILLFMQRTLSSATLSNEIKRNRIRLFFEVMGQDPYLLEHTFSHILSLPTKPIIFQCVDLVPVPEQFKFAGDANGNPDAKDDPDVKDDPDAKFLANCIVTAAISRITAQELDERWPPIVERLLNYRLSDATLNGQLSNMKLLNLVRLAEKSKSASLGFKNEILREALRTAGNFEVEGISPESQNKFCNLWNQLRDSAASTGYAESNASLILCEIRTIYDALHKPPHDTPIKPDLRPADYPLCNTPTHPHDPHSTPGASANIASASGEASDTARQLLSPATSRSASP